MGSFGRVAGLLVLVLGALAAPAAAGAHGKPEPPKRVLILVLDQLRPDYVDTFDMRNVRALMRDGADFPNAYLGHMASETVITHNVITSGRRPGRMGWSDEAFRDVDGVLGPKDGMYVSGSLTRDQFNALIAHAGYKKLPDYLHAARPGSKFIAVGQKNYAVYSSSNAAGDISLTFLGPQPGLRRRPPGCTRSTATASCRATTPRTSAATCGSPTPPWR